VEDSRRLLLRSISYQAHAENKHLVLERMLDPKLGARTTNKDFYHILREKFSTDLEGKLVVDIDEDVLYLVLSHYYRLGMAGYGGNQMNMNFGNNN